MSYGPNGDTKQNIFALRSRVGRQEEKITQLKERVAVLENLVQSTSDDRDAYAERCAELEQELAARGESRG